MKTFSWLKRYSWQKQQHNPPPDFRLPPKGEYTRPHHRRYLSLILISCLQSRHRQNSFQIFYNTRTVYSYRQAWRTSGIKLGTGTLQIIDRYEKCPSITYFISRILSRRILSLWISGVLLGDKIRRLLIRYFICNIWSFGHSVEEV
jgi:hypothetical protein